MKITEKEVKDLAPLLEEIDLVKTSVGYAPGVFEYLGFSIHKLADGIALAYADHIVKINYNEIIVIREEK
jgi:hypothetical protein